MVAGCMWDHVSLEWHTGRMFLSDTFWKHKAHFKHFLYTRSISGHPAVPILRSKPNFWTKPGRRLFQCPHWASFHSRHSREQTLQCQWNSDFVGREFQQWKSLFLEDPPIRIVKMIKWGYNRLQKLNQRTPATTETLVKNTWKSSDNFCEALRKLDPRQYTGDPATRGSPIDQSPWPSHGGVYSWENHQWWIEITLW